MTEQSRAKILGIVEWVGHDPERMAVLTGIFLGDNKRLAQRAAWAIQHLGQKNPHLFEPWLPRLVASLGRHPVQEAVKRNVVRLFEDIDIPETVLDELTDHCFGYLADPQEAIAVRCFSMSVLEKVCRNVPELTPELRLLIEENLEFGSPAFKNRGKKVLARLKANG